MADCLKCSVLTQRRSNQSNPDPDKFSYVDIKDSGYLPLLGLQVKQASDLCIHYIYNVIVIYEIYAQAVYNILYLSLSMKQSCN